MKNKKNKILFVMVPIIFFFGFLTAFNRTSSEAVPTKTEAVCTPAIASHPGDDILCALEMTIYADNPFNKLGLIAVNSRGFIVLNILQYEQMGEKRTLLDHTSYSEQKGVGDPKKGCTAQCQTQTLRYGVVDITITPNSQPISDKEMDDMFCPECKAAIEQMNPHCDLLLVDYAGGQYYDLCQYRYDFTIRERYKVITMPQEDGTVNVLITDLKVKEYAGMEVPVNPIWASIPNYQRVRI